MMSDTTKPTIAYKVPVDHVDKDCSEVLRFSLDRSQQQENFDKLVEKIKSQISKLSSDDSFQISWIDEDGDRVSINDEDGWKIAINEMSSKPLVKLSVTVRPTTNGHTDSMKAKEEHEAAHEAAHEKALEDAEKAEIICGLSQPLHEALQPLKKTTMTTTMKNGTLTNLDIKTEDGKAIDDGDLKEEVKEEEASLEEMFNQLSSYGADYMRQFGDMITNALESLDAYVAEGEEGEEKRLEMLEREKKEDQLEKKVKKSLDNLIDKDDEHDDEATNSSNAVGDLSEILDNLKQEEEMTDQKRHKD